MKLVRWWFVLACMVILALPASGGAQQKKYTIAVVPQAQVSEIFEKWLPFLKRLSRDTGVEFDLVPHNSMQQFEVDIQKGVPDFAYMNPYQVLNAKTGQGYIPLVRDKADLVGILVAHKGSGINSVKDLNGKQVAFPAPTAFAASAYIRALLAEKEHIKFTPIYSKTHGNVYRTVSLDKAAAGGGVLKTFNKEQPELKNQLTIIYETPGTPSHPIAVHPRVPEAVRNKVENAIKAMAQDPANKEMLNNIQIPEPVDADFQRDYLSLKKLKLEKYLTKEE